LDNTKKWESTHTYGVSSALRTASNLWLSKAWYTFYGWSTANGNLTRTYTDGQSISTLTTQSGWVIKLYAIMEQPVTFYSNTNKWTTNTATWYNNNNTCSVKVPAAPATISNWTALWWRDDTTAWDKEYAAAANTNITSCASSMYAVYGRSYTAHFYSAANKATDRTKQSSTGYYNSNTSSLPTTVSITLETAANSTDITNWTELWWRDDTTAWGKEYDYGSTQTVAWWTNFYSVYSRTLTITYDWNWNTAGSTSNTTKPVYMNANSTTTSDQVVTLATNGFTKTWYTFRKWKIWNTEYAEWW